MSDTTTVTVRLELTPSEALNLHHFISIHSTSAERTTVYPLRERLRHALRDVGVMR